MIASTTMDSYQSSRSWNFQTNAPETGSVQQNTSTADSSGDVWEPSSSSATEAAGSTQTNPLGDFDYEAFQVQVRQQLLDMVTQAKKALEGDDSINWVDPMLYAVDDGVEAAEVPEYWNAENTSQRIFDFAMSFTDSPDEEYILKARDAVLQGFKEAKDMMDQLPDSVAKLFNDTYDATMKKFDDLLEKVRNGTQAQDDAVDVPSAYSYSGAASASSALDLVA